MKKFLLFVFVLMGVCSLCSCEENELTNEDLISIVENEAAWNTAFENLEYDNFTTIIETSNQKDVAYICEKRACFIFNELDHSILYAYAEKNDQNKYNCYRSVINIENEDETNLKYNGYSSMEEAIQNRTWEKLDEITEEEYRYSILATIINISFTEQFKDFTYSKENKSYSYKGKITGKVLSDEGESVHDILCIDPIIHFENGKIISLKSGYESGTGENMIIGMVEYFDFQTTTIPQDILDDIEKM